MQFSVSTPPPIYSDEEIKKAIALSSHELLNQLSPDYLIDQATETMRFGDLPLAEQEALKQALLARTEDQLIKYQF